ncbi:MAG: 3-oxoacyl-ACP reductase [Proteobacteria bacterium]|nr:MAG: 3-oxoacyl-ACP reductase [Pseudomonadota bacterium]
MQTNTIDLSNRVAIVTGAARGIGLSVAKRFLESGASVSMWDLDAAALRAAGQQLSPLGRVAIEETNVTDEASVSRATQSTVQRFGKIDILVNNAGIGGPIVQTWEYDLATFQKVMEVNVVGVFLGCKHVIPIMRRQNYGRIVNIASLAGKNGTPNFSAYGASKAAVIALTKALGRELADTEILVNAVCPSAADTDILKQFTPEKVKWMVEQVPKGRFVRPDEIAAMVAWLASDECSFSTGQLFDISGGRSVY